MLLHNGIRWHREADVVVIGYGGAGAVSAISAHDAGAGVVVLEKQPQASHMSNTSMSGGLFVTVNDVPRAVAHLEGLYRIGDGLNWTDRDILQVWAEYCSHNRQWVEKLGGQTTLFRRGAEHRVVPGYESIEVYLPAGLGYGLHRWLREAVAARGVEVTYGAPARKLLTNFSGQVVGVSAIRDGREYNVKASRAVIMAPGGFEYDEQMKLNYLKVYPSHFYGAPANTGDGIRMAQDVGASLWHMNCCSARLVAKFPEFPVSFTMDLGGRLTISHAERFEQAGEPCAFIIVDKYGRRYTNDGKLKFHALYYELALYDSHRLEYPRVPSYWVFDANRVQRGPLPLVGSGPVGAHRLYKWSKDNQAEIDKGWIVQGDSVRELALTLGMEPGTLEQTISAYNAFCDHGEDPDFQRPPQHLKALQGPPFFAVRMWPGGPNTQGGPRRNRKAQVLNVDGNPIPRLYAAGEFGSIYGMLYPSAGGNIAECIVFGRIAGENAARETPAP